MKSLLTWGALAVLLVSVVGHAADAEPDPKPKIPVFFDPNGRLPKPDFAKVRSIRFLTTDDFPPFHFARADGTVAGFDVDLARAICADLKIACTIQARPFETLVAQIKQGNDDALIAAIADTSDTRKDLSFTAPYYTTPARFVVKAGGSADAPTPTALYGHSIGVEGGTAHEAYLKTFFPNVKLTSFPDQTTLRTALQAGKVEAIFGDGISFAIWLNSAGANGCCVFRGGPFTEGRFFGSGVSMAVAKGNTALRQALEYELAKLTSDGTYADLYLKYFPIGFY